MTVARGNGGNIAAQGGSLASGKPVFVEIRITGADFTADLVADPSNPVDVAAAIGSDLEHVAELVAEYGTILAVAVDGIFAQFIMDDKTSFADPAVAQDVFDRIVDDLGLTASKVWVTRYIDTYPFQAPT